MRVRHVLPLFIAGVLVVATPVFAGCGGGGDQTSTSVTRQGVIDAAMRVYDQRKASGTDFATGPCISESLPGFEDWAADIAHDPRQPVDDQPANQCQSYRDGQTHHFVELTPGGRLIRAQ
jgi:hypothetical protein